MPNTDLEHVWWGADTASDFRTLAGVFAATFGNLPTFVGRYVNSYAPSQEEIAYYHQNHMALLLICNAETGATSNGDYHDGWLLGAQAASLAHKMGYPAKCFLPIDIEATYMVSAVYLVGYFHGVDQGGYTPGAYLNVLNPEHIGAWISATAQFSLPAYIYSSEPEPYALWDAVNPAFYDFSQTGLGTAHAADVVLWQYGEGELNQGVDLDVATDLGHRLMWLPNPPPPTEYTVLQPAALKTYPNHVCKPAIDPQHQSVDLIPGTSRFTFTGRRTPHWSEVKLVNSPVHGWLLTADIALH